MKELLKNQTVLYVVAFIAVMNLFGFLLTKNVDAVMFYVVLGLLTSYFSKNMIVVLLVAMVGTNLLVAHRKGFSIREGMDSEENSEENSEEKSKKNSKCKSDNDCHGKHVKCTKGKCVNAAGFQNMNPKKYVPGKKGDKVKPDSAEQDEEEAGEKPELDFASTLEAAYDNFDDVLDSDALKNMSEDSQRLLKKQQKLMSNMKQIQPMMKQMGSFLSSFNLDALGGGESNNKSDDQ